MRIDDNWHRYYLSQLLICSVQNFQSIFVYVENKVKESGLALKFRFTRLSLFTIMLHTILLSTYLQLIQLNWNRFLVFLYIYISIKVLICVVCKNLERVGQRNIFTPI